MIIIPADAASSRKPASRESGSAPLFYGITLLFITSLLFIFIYWATIKRVPPPVAPPKKPLVLAPKAPATNTPAQAVLTNLAALPPETGAGIAELSPHDKANALSQQGTALMGDGRYEEAVQAYRAAIKLEPDEEDVHYNLAISLARIGKTDEAIDEYNEALKLVPDYSEAHNNLGNLLVKKGRLDEAAGHFAEAIKINPQHAPSHNNLGTVYGRQGKTVEATAEFARAVELSPEYLEARFNLGNSYLTQGKVREATQQFQEALRLNPQFKPARQALAKIASKTGQR